MPIPSRDKFDLSKQAKDSVSDRMHEKCGNCGHFLGNGLCEVIDGNVQADNLCDLWTLIEARPYYNKDFYTEEYNKTKEPAE